MFLWNRFWHTHTCSDLFIDMIYCVIYIYICTIAWLYTCHSLRSVLRNGTLRQIIGHAEPPHPRDLDAKCPRSAQFESPTPRATPHGFLRTKGGGRYHPNPCVYDYIYRYMCMMHACIYIYYNYIYIHVCLGTSVSHSMHKYKYIN
jgi:hypothetical protein